MKNNRIDKKPMMVNIHFDTIHQSSTNISQYGKISHLTKFWGSVILESRISQLIHGYMDLAMPISDASH